MSDTEPCPHTPAAPAFLVLQEGGSSQELYVHVSDTRQAADEFRSSCREDAYRTSNVVEIPPELASLGERLYSLLDEVAAASLTLD